MTNHISTAGPEQEAKGQQEDAVCQQFASEMKTQQHQKAPCFAADSQCWLPSRAPRPGSRDCKVDAHSRSGCSDSVTTCVRHTSKPSKSQRSAALIYKPHTLCTGTQASARAQCPWPAGDTQGTVSIGLWDPLTCNDEPVPCAGQGEPWFEPGAHCITATPRCQCAPAPWTLTHMEVGIPDGISGTSPHPALLPVALFHTKPVMQDFTNSGRNATSQSPTCWLLLHSSNRSIKQG